MDKILQELENLINKHQYPPIMDMRTSAKYLSISYDSLAREARIGRIKYKKLGNKKLFRKEWLDEWMEN